MHPTNIHQNYTEDIDDVRGGDSLLTIYTVHHVASFHVNLQEINRVQCLQKNMEEKSRERSVQFLETAPPPNGLCMFLERSAWDIHGVRYGSDRIIVCAKEYAIYKTICRNKQLIVECLTF